MSDLGGKRILVVEDDWVVADEIVRALSNAGAEIVGPAATLQACTALIDSGVSLDGALLDINLRGVPVYPAVKLLQARGVPCLFLTAYGADAVPSEFAHVPRVEKPFDPKHISAAMFGGRTPGS